MWEKSKHHLIRLIADVLAPIWRKTFYANITGTFDYIITFRTMHKHNGLILSYIVLAKQQNLLTIKEDDVDEKTIIIALTDKGKQQAENIEDYNITPIAYNNEHMENMRQIVENKKTNNYTVRYNKIYITKINKCIDVIACSYFCYEVSKMKINMEDDHIEFENINELYE